MFAIALETTFQHSALNIEKLPFQLEATNSEVDNGGV